jgi:hypothetical protein
MEKHKSCTCRCGSTAVAVSYQVTVPSFDDEGRWDGEDVITYDEIICDNPDCNNGLEVLSDHKRPLPQQKCDDDLPF